MIIIKNTMIAWNCDYWTINKSDIEKKDKTVEIKFLRSVAEITLLDQNRCEYIRTHINKYKMIDKTQQP